MIRVFNEYSVTILQIAIMSFKPHTTCNIETYIRKHSMCVWLKLNTADKIFIEIGLIIINNDNKRSLQLLSFLG